MATMERLAMVPFRWVGRRLDIRTLILERRPLFNAVDISKALQLPYDTTKNAFMGTEHYGNFAAGTVQVDGAVEASGDPVEFFTADDVYELASAPMVLDGDTEADDFLTWFEQTLEQLTGDRIDQVVAAATRVPVPLEHHSVRAAAKLLRIPERRLYDILELELDWIRRSAGDDGTPAPAAIHNALGKLLPVRVPLRRELYLQVRITPAGIEHLQAHLGTIIPLIDLVEEARS